MERESEMITVNRWQKPKLSGFKGLETKNWFWQDTKKNHQKI